MYIVVFKPSLDLYSLVHYSSEEAYVHSKLGEVMETRFVRYSYTVVCMSSNTDHCDAPCVSGATVMASIPTWTGKLGSSFCQAF